MRLPDFLDQLRSLDENARLEVKRGSQVGESALQTICAFANEPGLDGGTILLGVERTGDGQLFPDYIAKGIAGSDKVQADLVSQCRSVFNVPLSVTVTAEPGENGTVLIVDVPEVSPALKPVHFTRKPLPGGAFRRLGSADVRCTEDDIALLYQQRRAAPFDSSVVDGTSLADVDAEAMAVYRNTRVKVDPQAEELSYDDAGLLHSLNCLANTAQGPCLTLAGLLLFGRTTAMRRLLPMIRLDYVRVAGRQWVVGDGERFATTLDMRGPILTILNRAQAAIMDDLPSAFHLPEGKLQREDKPRLPLRVIREALVNALMHRSYRSQQPTQIVRFSNRLELRNPGYSLKAPDRLGEPGSIPRNPTIAAVLHELKFAETKGSGIRIMQAEMRKAGLSPASLESDREGDAFAATFLFHHFLEQEDIEWLARFRTLDLSDNMLKALVFVRERGLVNNATYRDIAQCHAFDATRDLRRLCELNLLEPEGNTTSRVYKPGSLMLEGRSATASQKGVADAMPNTADIMHDKEAAMHDKRVIVHGDAPATCDGDLPEELHHMVRLLGRRTEPALLHMVVGRLCGWRDLSVGELSDLLGRTETYIRTVVTTMVREGLLERTYPDTPRHPSQTYRSTRRGERP